MEEQKVYREIAPSGIEVVSTVPFKEPRWWDNPWLHIFWSYSSWGSMIAEDFGWSFPRKMFNKYLVR